MVRSYCHKELNRLLALLRECHLDVLVNTLHIHTTPSDERFNRDGRLEIPGCWTTVMRRQGGRSRRVYRSIAKERPWVEHLTSPPKKGVDALPHLTTHERPCHVYSNWMPSKQKIEQTITCNGTTSSFEVESLRHPTLSTAQWSP